MAKWIHSRKGPISGTVIWEADDVMDIRLDTEQTLSMASRFDSGYRPEGQVIRVRKSFMKEVTEPEEEQP